MGELGIQVRIISKFIIWKQPVKRGLNKCPEDRVQWHDLLNMVRNPIP
jgi:hypothetical protein